MTFDLLSFDFWWSDRLFGFWFGCIKGEELHRSLFCIYYNDGEWVIELFWCRLFTGFIGGK